MSSRKQNTITVSQLTQAQIKALRASAARQGVSPEVYARDLIADALRLEKDATRKTFAEISLPFQKALGDLSEDEINELSRPHRWKKKR